MTIRQNSSIVALKTTQDEVSHTVLINFFLKAVFFEDPVEFEAPLIADDDLFFGGDVDAVAIVTDKFPGDHGSDSDGHFDSVLGVAFIG